jgi:hypothetical protein
VTKAQRHGDVGERRVEAGAGFTVGVRGKLVAQYRQCRVAARERVTGKALE